MVVGSEQGWTVAPGTTPDSTALTIDENNSPQLEISFVDERYVDSPPLLSSVMEALRLDDVVRVDITLWRTAQWMWHVRQMKQLEEVQIESAKVLECFLDLWIIVDSPVPFDTPLTRGKERLRTSHYADSFPRLSTLVLHFNWRYFYDEIVGDGEGDGEGGLFGKFMRALVQRTRICGEKLPELRIKGSYIEKGMVDKFRNAVGTVVWDQTQSNR